MKKFPGNIIISRTDSIGDVILTLPIAGILKKYSPGIKIGFLGRAYTRPVIEACKHVDEFIELEDFLSKEVTVLNEKPEAIVHVFPVPEIAKRAKQLTIPIRIGTSHRVYHWSTCNSLVNFGRKKSELHEAQLNLKLLKPLGITNEFSPVEIIPFYGFENIKPLQSEFAKLVAPDKYNLILHPKSKGSSREWELNNYISLIHLLDKEKYQLFISGTAEERTALQPLFDAVGERVKDITGLMKLDQFIPFINECNGLIACSTGPLHIAAALGKDAYGIYPPMRPLHPGRWSPIGVNVKIFVVDKNCNACEGNNFCNCINEIEPGMVKKELDKKSTILFNTSLQRKL